MAARNITFLDNEVVKSLKYATIYQNPYAGPRVYLIAHLREDYLEPNDLRFTGFAVLKQCKGGWDLETFGDNFSKAEREYKYLEGLVARYPMYEFGTIET